MTIPPELEAQILRYYHLEKWRIGTIARQLRIHPEKRRPGSRPGGPAAHRRAAAAIEDRSRSAVHPRDAGGVPDADRQPPARDGLRTRLSRRAKPFPSRHRLPSATSASRGLSAPAHAAGRAGAMRLGPLDSEPDRRAPPACVCLGVERISPANCRKGQAFMAVPSNGTAQNHDPPTDGAQDTPRYDLPPSAMRQQRAAAAW